jgi:hypothetical protein
VERTQPDFDDFDDVAAQAATVGSLTTVEVLVRGGPTKDTVDLIKEAAPVPAGADRRAGVWEGDGHLQVAPRRRPG